MKLTLMKGGERVYSLDLEENKKREEHNMKMLEKEEMKTLTGGDILEIIHNINSWMDSVLPWWMLTPYVYSSVAYYVTPDYMAPDPSNRHVFVQ